MTKAHKRLATSMPTNFLCLPGELRNVIYEYLLVLQKPVTCRKPEKMDLTTGLLCANNAVHREASLTLYTQNTFDFTNSNSQEITSFLEQIGHKNASFIQSIHVDFPRFRYLDLYDIALGEDSGSILAKFETDCTTLSILTTSRPSTTRMVAKFAGLEHHRLAVNALGLVNSHFRAIHSLQTIIVELDHEDYSRSLRKEMNKLGWTIREGK